MVRLDHRPCYVVKVRVMGIICAAAFVLGACCQDRTGHRFDFTAGPMSTPAYTISEVVNCPLVAQAKGYGGDEFTGSIAIVGTGPDPSQVVTSAWINDRLLPALRSQGLSPGPGGLGEVCSIGRPIFFVKIDNWFVADRVVRAIAAEIEADQLSGEVDVVIEPPNQSCLRWRAPSERTRLT